MKTLSINKTLFLAFSLLLLFVYFPTFSTLIYDDDFGDFLDVANMSIGELFLDANERSYRPLFVILTFKVPYEFFGMSFFWNHFIQLMFHFFNIYLLYKISIKHFSFSKEKAFFIVLFFGLNSISTIFSSYLGINHITMGMSLILICLVLYDGASSKKNYRNNFLISCFYLMALLTTEYSYALILYLYFVTNKKDRTNFVKRSYSLILITVVFFLIKSSTVDHHLFGNWKSYKITDYEFIDIPKNIGLGIFHAIVPSSNMFVVSKPYDTWLYTGIFIIFTILLALYRRNNSSTDRVKKNRILLFLGISFMIHFNPYTRTSNPDVLHVEWRFWYFSLMTLSFLVAEVAFVFFRRGSYLFKAIPCLYILVHALSLHVNQVHFKIKTQKGMDIIHAIKSNIDPNRTNIFINDRPRRKCFLAKYLRENPGRLFDYPFVKFSYRAEQKENAWKPEPDVLNEDMFNVITLERYFDRCPDFQKVSLLESLRRVLEKQWL